MIRAQVALLDIDGTLLDSTYHHALAWARAFAEVGHPVPVWRLHRRIGMGGDRADAWTTAEDAAESKPHPELLEAALDRTRGDRAVMIGDATWDAIAAARVGVPTIGLRCGGFGEAELRAAGAVAVYDDPADLLAHLDEALVRSS
jgi:phosphoglycolate phosphatase-like HAD superfamily hydrolase